MSKWKQEIYVNGEPKYEPMILSDADLVAIFAQVSILRQAGVDIKLYIVGRDSNYVVTKYKVLRISNDRITLHIYTKLEG